MSDAIDKVPDVVDKVLSHFETMLRYVASGFVTIFFIKVAGLRFEPFCGISEKLYPWAVVIGAILLGIAIYAVNSAVLVPVIWWRFFVWQYKVRRYTWIPSEYKNYPVSDLMYNLVTQRWLRRASENRNVKCIQNELDKWSAMLNYLYCSSYPAIVVAFWSALHEQKFGAKFGIILGAGIVLLLCALISDYRITAYEFRVRTEYPVGNQTTVGTRPSNWGLYVRIKDCWQKRKSRRTASR
jgi:hypothetical protein